MRCSIHTINEWKVRSHMGVIVHVQQVGVEIVGAVHTAVRAARSELGEAAAETHA